MSSTNKCEYCGATITSADQKCPNCDAPNPLYVVDAPRVILAPHTIKELQEFCAERGMPLERMRFFIGIDYKEPRAFGVYYDEVSNEYVTYKNKDTGERAIRYHGPSEEIAVNELYLKLLDECHKRGIYPETPDGKPVTSTSADDFENETITKVEHKIIGGEHVYCINNKQVSPEIYEKIGKPISNHTTATVQSGTVLCILIFLFYKGVGMTGDKNADILKVFVLSMIPIIMVGISYMRNAFKMPRKNFLRSTIFLLVFILATVGTLKVGCDSVLHPEGYYQMDGQTVYHIGQSWYSYDSDTSDWSSMTSSESEAYSSSATDYYVGETWNSGWGDISESFTNSDAYDRYIDDHSSSPDYDSWDSGGTDWSSDW